MTRGGRRALLAALSGAALLAAAGCERAAPSFRASDITGTSFGRDFALADHQGRPRTLADFRGKVVVMFFGYTHCPDVCPTTLADIRDALRLLDRPVGVVFVTIDPARDGAAAMKQYVDYYRSGFVGLTGSEAEIAAAAEAWGVSYSRLDTGSASGYAMAHSTDTYLVDGEGMLRHHLFFGASPELIAERIREVAG